MFGTEDIGLVSYSRFDVTHVRYVTPTCVCIRTFSRQFSGELLAEMFHGQSPSRRPSEARGEKPGSLEWVVSRAALQTPVTCVVGLARWLACSQLHCWVWASDSMSSVCLL